MKRQNIRTLSLVVGTFTYLLIGAAVFDSFESEQEYFRNKTLQDITKQMVRKYNITKKDFTIMETVIIESKPHKAGPQWKFAGALYFSTVVLVMIGYGHSTPATYGGKAFCMMYAMIGIPLGMVMFQSIGERLNKFTSVVIKLVKRCLRFSKPEATETNVMAATGCLSATIFLAGAAMFSHYEGWTYFDSLYYCFVTLTTIGFGDYVALQNEKDKSLSRRPLYVMLCLVFILFGLAVVAASINLLLIRFMTMNAENMKRDDTDLQLSQELEELEGEVMAINGKMLATASQPTIETSSDLEQASVCSCTCYGYGGTASFRSRYSLKRSAAARFCHMLPMETIRKPAQDDVYDNFTDEKYSMTQFSQMKRASL